MSALRRSKQHQSGLRVGLACQMQQGRRRSKNELWRNQSSITLERCEASSSLVQKMESIKRPLRTQERNWKILWKRLCPERLGQERAQRTPRETVASESAISHKKSKYACTVEAHESTGKLLEPTLPRNHEDHTAEKGFNSTIHYNLVLKLIPMPQAMNILQWTRNGRSSRRCQRGN